MNQILPFDRGLIESIRVNPNGVEARAATLGTRRTFKVEAQVAAYVGAVGCMDLTTLDGGDTPGKVRSLCALGLNPVRRDILAALGVTDPITVGAICVYHAQILTAVRALQGRLPVAAVSTAFPDGEGPLDLRVPEIERSISAGATEIDMVIRRESALRDRWVELYEDIKACREACGDKAKLKVILGTGNLGTYERIAKASAVAIMAGADTIKTSTGKDPVNATLPVGLVMVWQIRRFCTEVDPGRRVGFKPAGGIKSAKDAMLWMSLMREELGIEWTRPDLFRIGASSLLGDLQRQLEHLATGQYSAAQYHPQG